jgi:hypothetical protein
MTTYTTRFVSVAEDRGQRVPWLNSMQIWLKLIVSLGSRADCPGGGHQPTGERRCRPEDAQH